jgi:tRNA (cytidine/uridine-2'-O-)-methyltransferase
MAILSCPQNPFHVVLINPEIPQNTGNIGRTVAAADAQLHVVHPIGFDMSGKARRRAGLDYWDESRCHEHASWLQYLSAAPPRRAWLLTTDASGSYWDAEFLPGDTLIFGRESDGAPAEVHSWIRGTFGDEHRLSIPMAAGTRSLNLATAVCTVLYEALRQVAGPGEHPQIDPPPITAEP